MKKTFILLIIVTIILSLCSCGNDDKKNNPEETKEKEEVPEWNVPEGWTADNFGALEFWVKDDWIKSNHDIGVEGLDGPFEFLTVDYAAFVDPNVGTDFADYGAYISDVTSKYKSVNQWASESEKELESMSSSYNLEIKSSSNNEWENNYISGRRVTFEIGASDDVEIYDCIGIENHGRIYLIDMTRSTQSEKITKEYEIFLEGIREYKELNDSTISTLALNSKVLSNIGKEVEIIIKEHPELVKKDQAHNYMLHSSEVTFGKEIGYFFDLVGGIDGYYDNIKDIPKGTECVAVMGEIDDFIENCPDEIDRNEFLNRMNATEVEFIMDGDEESGYSQIYLYFTSGGYRWTIDGIHFNNNPTHFDTIYKGDIIKVEKKN